MIEFDS